jgi:uncharacterized protein
MRRFQLLNRKFLRRCGFCLGGLAAIALAAALDAYLYEPTHPKVYRQTLRFPHVPDELTQLKIVHLSDLHIVVPGVRERRMIGMVNDLRPDLILLTGDYVEDDGITPGEHDWQDCARNAVSVIRQLKPRLGTYSVLGNWDAPAMARMLRDVGINVLQDEAVILDIRAARLAIAGVDSSRGGLKSISADALKADFAILLSHYPETAESVAALGLPVNLVLAGHYHGGQVRVPFASRIFGQDMRYIAGEYDVEGTKLYVNRGIGMHTEAVRFLCRPEVTLIRLTGG